jgi:hypothetical protein
MRRSMPGYICVLFVIVVVIAGCAPQSLIASPSLPSHAPGDVYTAIAQTAAFAQGQTLTALPPTITPTLTSKPTNSPTITPSPTATVLFLIPTETLNPVILLAPTTSVSDSNDNNSDGDGNNPQATETPEKKNYFKDKEWACIVQSKSPANGTIISPKTRFKVRWIVKNMGTKTWPKQGVDVVFKRGAHIHDRAYYDIPATISPGGTVSIELTFTAPRDKKTYNTYWTLKVGKREFCTLPFTFEVK